MTLLSKLNIEDNISNFFENIIFEIWIVEPRHRLKYIEVAMDPNIQQGFVDGLNHGIYELNVRYIFIGGKELSSAVLSKKTGK